MLISRYVYTKLGLLPSDFDRLGSHTLTTRPRASYSDSVTLPFGSVTFVPKPVPMSSAVVVAWSFAFLTVVAVTGPVSVGTYVVCAVSLSFMSLTNSARPRAS